MRTSKERMQDFAKSIVRNTKRIYEQQIDPFLDFVELKYLDDEKEQQAINRDCITFFLQNNSKYYNDYKDFRNEVTMCIDIYYDKLGGDAVFQKMNGQTHENFDITQVKSDYDFMKTVGETSVKLLNWIKNRASTRSIIKRNEAVQERKKEIEERMEHAHEYPRNLRPPMSQGRLYGEKTCAPQRKRAAPKKRTPLPSKKNCPVKVNFKRMI